jgi:hypothetical protein
MGLYAELREEQREREQVSKRTGTSSGQDSGLRPLSIRPGALSDNACGWPGSLKNP